MFLFQVSKTAKAPSDIVFAKKGEMLPAEQLVKNVVSFKFDSKKSDFENVRAFVENGGLRTAPKSTSGKTFGDIIYVPNDAAIKVGDKPVNRGGRQVMEPVVLKLEHGLYTWSNDTEGAIKLISLDDPARQVNMLFQKTKSATESSFELAFGRVEKDGKMSVNADAVSFIKESIQSTQWLFKNNPNMSITVEKVMSLLYRGGKGRASASEQDEEGMKVLRNTAKSVMSSMTSDNMNELAGLLANSATPSVIVKEELKSIAKDMVRLLQDSPKSIGLRVEYGKIYLNVYSGSRFPKAAANTDTFNPVVVHSFSLTDKTTFPTESGYRKEFTSPFGLLGTEVDYDNPRAVWEGMHENQLRVIYNQSEGSLFVTRPRMFVIDVTIKPEEFDRSLREAVRLQDMSAMVPKKAR